LIFLILDTLNKVNSERRLADPLTSSDRQNKLNEAESHFKDYQRGKYFDGYVHVIVNIKVAPILIIILFY